MSKSIWLPGRSVGIQRRPHVFHAKVAHYRNGELIWVNPGAIHNILHDEGEQWILANSFDTDHSAAGVPSSIYLGLDARSALAESDELGMGGFNEPSGGNYARKAISTSTGFTLSQPSSYYIAATGNQVFTSSGGSGDTIGTVENLFIASTSDNTGLLIASLALSTSRTLNDQDALTVSFSIGLSD